MGANDNRPPIPPSIDLTALRQTEASANAQRASEEARQLAKQSMEVALAVFVMQLELLWQHQAEAGTVDQRDKSTAAEFVRIHIARLPDDHAGRRALEARVQAIAERLADCDSDDPMPPPKLTLVP